MFKVAIEPKELSVSLTPEEAAFILALLGMSIGGSNLEKVYFKFKDLFNKHYEIAYEIRKLCNFNLYTTPKTEQVTEILKRYL